VCLGILTAPDIDADMFKELADAGSRAQGVVGPNRPGSILWAGKQEKRQLWERCFFLTPLSRTNQALNVVFAV